MCAQSVIKISRVTKDIKMAVRYDQKHQESSVLLHLCSQIREKATTVFYSLATIQLLDFTCWWEIHATLGPRACRLIRTIHFTGYTAGSIYMNYDNTKDVWDSGHAKEGKGRCFRDYWPSLEHVEVNVSPRIKDCSELGFCIQTVCASADAIIPGFR